MSILHKLVTKLCDVTIDLKSYGESFLLVLMKLTKIQLSLLFVTFLIKKQFQDGVIFIQLKPQHATNPSTKLEGLYNLLPDVVINNAKSDFCDLVSGVLQESLLEPLLFLIYMNDLPNIIHSPLLLFADDTKIFHQISSHHGYIQLQLDILALEKWSKLWRLILTSLKHLQCI